jgi:hypothetical protein
MGKGKTYIVDAVQKYTLLIPLPTPYSEEPKKGAA